MLLYQIVNLYQNHLINFLCKEFFLLLHLKNLPTIPLIFAIGIKMAKSIAEIAKIEKDISFTPSKAASYLLFPSSSFYKYFLLQQLHHR